MTLLSTAKEANFGGSAIGLGLGLVLGLVSSSSLVGVCRHLAAVVSVTSTYFFPITYVYSTRILFRMWRTIAPWRAAR